MQIEKFAFTGEGMSRVYENAKWLVGIKNWKPANDITGIDCLERHNQSDELFVLLSGRCTLIAATEKDGKLEMTSTEMEPMQVYNIPKTLWHNTITQKDTKMVLIEDSSTGNDNSDVKNLSNDEIATLKTLVK